MIRQTKCVDRGLAWLVDFATIEAGLLFGAAVHDLDAETRRDVAKAIDWIHEQTVQRIIERKESTDAKSLRAACDAGGSVDAAPVATGGQRRTPDNRGDGGDGGSGGAASIDPGASGDAGSGDEPIKQIRGGPLGVSPAVDDVPA